MASQTVFHIFSQGRPRDRESTRFLRNPFQFRWKYVRSYSSTFRNNAKILRSLPVSSHFPPPLTINIYVFILVDVEDVYGDKLTIPLYFFYFQDLFYSPTDARNTVYMTNSLLKTILQAANPKLNVYHAGAKVGFLNFFDKERNIRRILLSMWVKLHVKLHVKWQLYMLLVQIVF
jgi:hypothetical protein